MEPEPNACAPCHTLVDATGFSVTPPFCIQVIGRGLLFTAWITGIIGRLHAQRAYAICIVELRTGNSGAMLPTGAADVANARAFAWPQWLVRPSTLGTASWVAALWLPMRCDKGPVTRQS